MQKPYRRVFGLYLVINLLVARSLSLPYAGIAGHFLHADLGGIMRLWGYAILVHVTLTLFLIPFWVNWLARKDAERLAAQERRREEKVMSSKIKS